jgi:hypothetical protein
VNRQARVGAGAPTGNPYEAIARARKASRLCNVMVAAIDATPEFPLTPKNIHLICTSDTAEPFRRDFERLAGVRRSSEITWAMVEGLLTEHYFASPTNIVDLFDRREPELDCHETETK